MLACADIPAYPLLFGGAAEQVAVPPLVGEMAQTPEKQVQREIAYMAASNRLQQPDMKETYPRMLRERYEAAAAASADVEDGEHMMIQTKWVIRVLVGLIGLVAIQMVVILLLLKKYLL